MKHACEKVSALASEQLERALTLSERLTMGFHFLMCSACHHYSRNIKKLNETLTLKRNGDEKAVDSSTVLPENKRHDISETLDRLPTPVNKP